MFFSSTILITVSFLGGLVQAAPTIYLVGDSTMTNQPDSSGIEGWGVFLPNYVTLPIVNKAIGGRSARSFRREGRWTEVLGLLKSGDYVVIEFGHNDGGSPSSSDRASTGGEGSETQTVTLADGTVEVVQTFSTYLRWYVDEALAKGAIPILSGQTPNNPYENVSEIAYGPPRFVPYAKNVATAKGVAFVDHYLSTWLLYQKLGKATVDGYFLADHTHTNPAGAQNVAYAFISGLKCDWAKGVLGSYISAAGASAGARCTPPGSTVTTSTTKDL